MDYRVSEIDRKRRIAAGLETHQYLLELSLPPRPPGAQRHHSLLFAHLERHTLPSRRALGRGCVCDGNSGGLYLPTATCRDYGEEGQDERGTANFRGF